MKNISKRKRKCKSERNQASKNGDIQASTQDEKPLTAIQGQVLAFYIANGSVKSTSRKFDLNESTIYRWMKLPKWIAAQERAIERLICNVEFQNRRLYDKSIMTLDSLMDSKNERVRADASRTVFARLAPLYGDKETQDRLEIMIKKVMELDELTTLSERDTLENFERKERLRQLSKN